MREPPVRNANQRTARLQTMAEIEIEASKGRRPSPTKETAPPPSPLPPSLPPVSPKRPRASKNGRSDGPTSRTHASGSTGRVFCGSSTACYATTQRARHPRPWSRRRASNGGLSPSYLSLGIDYTPKTKSRDAPEVIYCITHSPRLLFISCSRSRIEFPAVII